MVWLLSKQEHFEASFAKRHLAEGTLLLSDASSTYFEGRCCPLAHIGHSRDGPFDRAQIDFGSPDGLQGWPVAIEVFDCNTAPQRGRKAKHGTRRG